MSGHKAIKEWENIPTVYEERKTMSKSIEEILEKYGWVWCTECGKEKVYDGTMCSGCREWLIK